MYGLQVDVFVLITKKIGKIGVYTVILDTFWNPPLWRYTLVYTPTLSDLLSNDTYKVEINLILYPIVCVQYPVKRVCSPRKTPQNFTGVVLKWDI